MRAHCDWANWGSTDINASSARRICFLRTLHKQLPFVVWYGVQILLENANRLSLTVEFCVFYYKRCAKHLCKSSKANEKFTFGMKRMTRRRRLRKVGRDRDRNSTKDCFVNFPSGQNVKRFFEEWNDLLVHFNVLHNRLEANKRINMNVCLTQQRGGDREREKIKFDGPTDERCWNVFFFRLFTSPSQQHPLLVFCQTYAFSSFVSATDCA